MELAAATGAQHSNFDDVLIRAIAARLPHRAQEIHAAYEHVIWGAPDLTLRCCKR